MNTFESVKKGLGGLVRIAFLQRSDKFEEAISSTLYIQFAKNSASVPALLHGMLASFRIPIGADTWLCNRKLGIPPQTCCTRVDWTRPRSAAQAEVLFMSKVHVSATS